MRASRKNFPILKDHLYFRENGNLKNICTQQIFYSTRNLFLFNLFKDIIGLCIILMLMPTCSLCKLPTHSHWVAIRPISKVDRCNTSPSVLLFLNCRILCLVLFGSHVDNICLSPFCKIIFLRIDIRSSELS